MARVRKRKIVGATPDRWERLRHWLKAHQHLARRAVWLLAVAYAVIFVWVAGDTIVHALAARRQADTTHTFPAHAPEGAGRSQPDYHRANPDAQRADPGSVLTGSRVPGADVDWRSAVHLRRAAAVCAAEGDLAGAISLLLQDPGADAVAGQLSETVYRRLDQTLDELWPAEFARLQAMLQAVDANQLPTWLAPTRPLPPLADLVNAANVDPPTAMIALPESLRFCVLTNLHVGLHEDQQVPDQLIGLLLETRFPEPGLARRLYLDAPPTARIDYADHIAVFNAALTARILGPMARLTLIDLRNSIATAGDQTHAWFVRLVGKDVDIQLKALAPTTPVADVAAIWQRLPAPLHRLWSRRLQQQWDDRQNPALAPAVRRANTWLAPADDELTSGPLLVAIRRHPDWQNELRMFAYDGAGRQVPAICAQLLAAEYTLPLQVQLVGPLSDERAKFMGSRRDWRAVPRILGIDASLPPVNDRQRELWGRISPSRMLQAMQRAIAELPAPRQPYARQLMQLYALNRGYTEDPDENKAMQPAPAPAPVGD